jgi:hypothetical protein
MQPQICDKMIDLSFIFFFYWSQSVFEQYVSFIAFACSFLFALNAEDSVVRLCRRQLSFQISYLNKDWQ